MASCTVVMVSYYTGPVLFPAIRAVLADPALAELIVVDNGNPVDVLERLHAWVAQMPGLALVSGHGNVGFSRGCNLGTAQATGDYLLLLNPDSLLPPGALARLMAALDAIPQAMLSGALLLNPDGSEQRASRRELLTPQTAVAEALGLHRLCRVKRHNIHDTPLPESVSEVPAISGACMCLRRSDYEKLGGMDEGYFLHVEDLDLCWRVHRAGGRVVFDPQVRLVHLRSTSEASSVFVEWCKARSFMRYFTKNLEGSPPGLLPLAKLAILCRFGLKVTGAKMKRSFRRSAPAHAESVAAKKLLLLHDALCSRPEQALRERNILITGATGPLGLCTAGRLLAAGARVTAVSRSADLPVMVDGFRWLAADLGRPIALQQGEKWDTAVHCAPLWLLPVQLEALANAGVKRVVAFGSTSVFGKAKSENAGERMLVNRLATAERDIERGCAVLGMEWTILRPTLIYGAGLDANVSRLARFIRRFGVLPLTPPAKGLREPVHVDDLAQAALAALDNPAAYGHSYNVSGGERLTYRAMAERIFACCGLKPRFIMLPFLPRLLDMAGRLKGSSLNGEMARRMNEDLVFFHDEAAHDFGYAPRPFLAAGAVDLP